MPDTVAGRAYARVYHTTGRTDLHEFLTDAVVRSGGRLLYSSSPQRAPIYFGIQTPGDERVGILVYPFRATHREIKNRPDDEHRLQIRYGSESTWDDEHPIGRDVANVDTTLVVGVHLKAQVLVGLDPTIYDPLPMGISIEFKEEHVQAAQDSDDWHVFERDNITGRKRPSPRAVHGLETIVIFKQNRLLDYVRLERKAADLTLDPALRFSAATAAASPHQAHNKATASLHDLESQFDMSSTEILEMISHRNRLSVAVRGGVAEHHLHRVLSADDAVAVVESIDIDGRHDFDVTLHDGRLVRVECKNSSPKRYSNGDMKVEVQKTRATQGDPAGRLYRTEQFDVLAACLFAPTGEWRFAYRATAVMDRDKRYPDRLAPLHHVTEGWATTLVEAL